MSDRVYLVEDHPLVREAYATVLALEPGLDVCGMAETAEDALVGLEGLDCDLVITDVRLPGMSGIDLVARLTAERPGLPTLVITGHEDDVFAERAREAGAAGFLPKRRAAAELVPTIRSLLHPAGAA